MERKFKIGQEVKSTIGPMRGRVVGYDDVYGGYVVMTESTDEDSRVRYTYKEEHLADNSFVDIKGRIRIPKRYDTRSHRIRIIKAISDTIEATVAGFDRIAQQKEDQQRISEVVAQAQMERAAEKSEAEIDALKDQRRIKKETTVFRFDHGIKYKINSKKEVICRYLAKVPRLCELTDLATGKTEVVPVEQTQAYYEDIYQFKNIQKME